MDRNDYDPNGFLTPKAYADWYARQTAAVGKRCALIMAGGHSSRMGADKPSVTVEGQTMLRRAAEFWKNSGMVDRVLVAVGPAGHLAEEIPPGTVAVADLVSDRGPLAGLQAAFHCTDAEILWVSGVDMPFLTKKAVLPEPEGDSAVYLNDGRPEPLFGVYRRSALPTIDELLNEGVGKMGELLRRLNTTYVEPSAVLAAAFRNVNTPEELFLARAGSPPLIPVTAWSGTGKTTALEGIIPALTRRGVRVSAIKHDAHQFEVDQPGKDTYRLSAAGAQAVAIMNQEKWAVMGEGVCTLDALRAKLPDCDVILAEGFKYSRRPKLEIHRKATGKPLISDPADLIAVLTDELLDIDVPQLALDDYSGCAELLCRQFHLGE